MNFLVFLPWLFFSSGLSWVTIRVSLGFPGLGFYLVGVSVMQCYMKLYFWFFLGLPVSLFGSCISSSSSCMVTTFEIS
ncbi:hypothetical protein CMEL01_13390 [Colletotrichum melonis]|uniref:Uncharacterized protein n=2 Tax=Colletotrichum acutatum species complex TaxID=2707335 RepID=A0AAI9UUS9_9PEZI|nr:hypothetical protein CMEL01_13390 [Colletotrichum melonis]